MLAYVIHPSASQLPQPARRVWAVLGLCWVLVAAGAGCQSDPAAPTSAPSPAGLVSRPPLPAALRRLLAPYPTNDPTALRADSRRLRAARATWAADSAGRFLVNFRLADNQLRLNQPDSAMPLLRRAETAARPLARQWPAETATLADVLASEYWKQRAYDSAHAYYVLAARRLTAAQLDTVGGRAWGLYVSGETLNVGTKLAGIVTNAGMVSSGQGNLPVAVRHFERAIGLYRAQHAAAGLIWAQSLLAEAVAEQGDDPGAARRFEQALTAARAYHAATATTTPDEDGPGIAFAYLLDGYAPVLERQRRGAYLLQLVAEGRAWLDTSVRARPPVAGSNDRRHHPQALLDVLAARTHLAAGAPDRATALLRRADAELRAIRTSADVNFRHNGNYYALRARWLGLHGWQAQATGGRGEPWLTAAARTLDSVLTPGARASGQLLLARVCLDAGEPARAVPLLRTLTTSFDRTRNQPQLATAATLLARAYVVIGRPDSAYHYEHATRLLLDTLRAARQYGALAALETRYRTREKEVRIRHLTERAGQEQRQTRWALGSALLLALMLGGVAWALRLTRRFNGQLATQRNQLQDQATRLGELDLAKNQFFANVAHELRTPLTLVLGPLENLLTAPAPPDLGTVRQTVGLAHRHGQRLLELVNRILDLTKLQAGRLTPQPVATPLAPLVRRLVEQFSSLAAARQVGLHAPVLPDGLTLLLDGDKIEQIITNLLANALAHTPPGGAVLVTANLSGAPGWYALTVRDTGPGIAEAEQARVFERFYQSPQKHAQGGTGLGLALSRELAEILGGTLTLVSQPGEGAAFTLRFPAERVPSEGTENEVTPPPHASPTPALTPHAFPKITYQKPATSNQTQATTPRARILIVEDQPDLRAYLRQLLEPTYEVLEAEDGQAALDVLTREAPVDLITTDAMMPRLSGTELLERLKADARWRSLPVLMLTARADDATAWRRSKSGSMTTSPSRSARSNCWRGCAPCWLATRCGSSTPPCRPPRYCRPRRKPCPTPPTPLRPPKPHRPRRCPMVHLKRHRRQSPPILCATGARW